MANVRNKQLLESLGVLLVLSAVLGWEAREASAVAKPVQMTVVLLADQEHNEITTEFEKALASHLKVYSTSLTVHRLPTLNDLSIEDARRYARLVEKNGDRVALVTWCDFSTSEESVLYMSQPGDSSLLVREISEDDVGEKGRSDALATVVTGAVEALSLGAQLGVSSEHSALSVMEKLLPDYEQGGISAMFDVAYAPRFVNTDKPFTNAGGIALGILFQKHWSVALSYTYHHFILDDNSERYLLVSNGHEVGIRGEFLWEWDRISLSGRLGVDLAFIKWRVAHEFVTGSTYDQRDLSSYNLGIEAAVLIGARIQPWLRIRTGPGLICWPINHDYDTGAGSDYNSNSQTLLEPWDFQPYWIVSATVTIN